MTVDGRGTLEMKSPLQERAEAIAQRFRTAARSPIVIEFAGVPKAGKTTTLNHVQAFLRRCGFRVEVVVERASVCPIRDKKHSNFNVWTACTTLAQVLDKTQIPPRPDDPDILILDRGIFDSIWWLALMERLARIRREERELIERFLLIEDWRRRLTGVVVMTTKPDDALNREKGYLPVEGAQGSIMNRPVLQQSRDLVDYTMNRLRDKFNFFHVDTSSRKYNKPAKACIAVADVVLNWIDEQLQEDILSLPKPLVRDLFKGADSLTPGDARSLVASFARDGEFRPRVEVEADDTRVQALPVVVVRNRSGQVLRLRRKEKKEDNPLHEKIVIWAGGHVRTEDSHNGNSLLQCAIRELQEELRLSVNPTNLKLLGSVYADHGESTSKHVAVVYEWRAETDDVSVALSSSEFFERQGTSLSGSFVAVENLAEDVEAGRLSEAWSAEIVRSLLAPDHKFTERLI
jgi:predicted NUDIX family phosphoesterase